MPINDEYDEDVNGVNNNNNNIDKNSIIYQSLSDNNNNNNNNNIDKNSIIYQRLSNNDNSENDNINNPTMIKRNIDSNSE